MLSSFNWTESFLVQTHKLLINYVKLRYAKTVSEQAMQRQKNIWTVSFEQRPPLHAHNEAKQKYANFSRWRLAASCFMRHFLDAIFPVQSILVFERNDDQWENEFDAAAGMIKLKEMEDIDK